MGKSTLVRQLGRPVPQRLPTARARRACGIQRVLEDIANGVNAVGVTEYFARLYDANYRDAAQNEGPGR